MLQRKSPAGCTAFLHGARRAGWRRKGSGPRREDGEAQREALTAARNDHARKLKAAPLAAAPRKIAGAPSGDMKRDTGTKVYPTDADAKKNIIQSHYQ